MNKTQFLESLIGALEGEVSHAVLNDNIRYYRDYIENEVKNGKSERQVLEELGDPTLIARTIIDVSGNGRRVFYSEGYEDSRSWRGSNASYEQQKGFHTEYNEEGGYDIKYGSFKLNSWYAKLLLIVAVLAVVSLVISIIGGLISIIAPIAVPVLLICILISFFRGNRR